MNSIENIYICLAAPLLLALLCLGREARRGMIFMLAGMTASLLSAYVSSFVSSVLNADLLAASYEIAPAVEETMKFLPLLFYLMVFEPEKKRAISGALRIAVSFATFENVCFLTSYGTNDLLLLVIRGFSTGAMHVVCGMLVAIGLFFLWDRLWFRIVGSFALLCLVITFHAIFNILVNQSGLVFWIGSVVPLTVVIIWLIFFKQKIGLS